MHNSRSIVLGLFALIVLMLGTAGTSFAQEDGSVVIPPVTGELTHPFAFVMNDTPVFSDSARTTQVGVAVRHQSFPLVQEVTAPSGLVAIRISYDGKTHFVSSADVQVAERDYVMDWSLNVDEVFELGLINGCPDLREAREIVAIRTSDGSDGSFALERISTEFCSYRFSGTNEVTAVAPLGSAIQFLNYAGLGDGERVSTFAMTVRFLVGYPPADQVNSNICGFVQAAVTDALDRPAPDRFDVQPYNVTCPNLDRTVPTEVTAAQVVTSNAITIAAEGTPNSGCPILPPGSAENQTVSVALERIDTDWGFYCRHQYQSSANIGIVTFVVPEGVHVIADDANRYCAGQTVAAGAFDWYWDSSTCTPGLTG